MLIQLLHEFNKNHQLHTENNSVKHYAGKRVEIYRNNTYNILSLFVGTLYSNYLQKLWFGQNYLLFIVVFISPSYDFDFINANILFKINPIKCFALFFDYYQLRFCHFLVKYFLIFKCKIYSGRLKQGSNKKCRNMTEN